MSDCGTILVVDHDEATRSAGKTVAARLGYDVRLLESGTDALEHFCDDRPVLAILEVELPGEASGLELLREFHERFGDDLPVILVSAGRTTTLDCVSGLLLGADDYLAKPLDTGELLARVRRSLRRSAVANGNPPTDSSLSPREGEILTMLAEGKTQDEIAAELVISPKTVGTHIQHLLAKLGVHSRAQAIASAYRSGLIEPSEGHRLDAELVLHE